MNLFLLGFGGTGGSTFGRSAEAVEAPAHNAAKNTAAAPVKLRRLLVSIVDGISCVLPLCDPVIRSPFKTCRGGQPVQASVCLPQPTTTPIRTNTPITSRPGTCLLRPRIPGAENSCVLTMRVQEAPGRVLPLILRN
mmetsp:Transcript_72333/g.172752  ORF Transcript_72333/g.172752 Transcript_72333/m.172752 type:complete len:137 (-) Transcript_72333:19-429(-)